MRVALVGEESAGIQALRLVAERGHELVAVFAQEGGARGATNVAEAARAVGAAVHDPREVTTPGPAELLREREVDLLLNVHGLHIVHADILEAPSIGAFNLHPGPLPEYAGLNAPSWAILSGEESPAATLHWMAPEVDAGPIAYRADFPIPARATGLSLSLECVRRGVPLIGELLDAAERGPGSIPSIEQDRSRGSWFGPEAPYGGRVPWSEPARRIDALVRASDYGPFASPWGRPRAQLDGADIVLLATDLTDEPAESAPGTVLEVGDDGALVACGEGVLRVRRVESAGEAREAADVLRAGRRFNA